MNALSDTVKLNNGIEIPRIGLGVYQAGSGEGTQNAVQWALAAGYRHIDTAHIYRNEVDVGVGIRNSDIPREALFVTTKLWNDDHGYDRAMRAFDTSLDALGLEWVDLYLIHWPVQKKRKESWRALSTILDSGRARSIGVSNFMVSHLEELAEASDVVPAINQIELHPFLQQREVVQYCRTHGIVVEAYSPLTKGRYLDDRELVSIAGEVGCTPAQVLIAWSLQHDFVTLPKSSSKTRIEQNFVAREMTLTETQMQRLDTLDRGLRTAWDPTTVP